MMKKHIFLMIIAAVAIAVSGYAQNTPRYAVSTRTWTFGDQIWSDAIRIPTCNKPSFTKSNTSPHCCSYTGEDETTRYYYNWPYVNANEDVLCPSPWRVPSESDFSTLVSSDTNYSTLISAWGFGGHANGSDMRGMRSKAQYWSSTENSSNTNNAYYLACSRGSLLVDSINKYYGFQVRCVKQKD